MPGVRSASAVTALASLLGLLLVGLVAPGCSNSDDDGHGTPGGDDTPECTDRSQCAPGEVCSTDGRCGGCESSGQCLLKEECHPETFLCALKSGWGTDCQRNEDCSAGRWCRQGLCVTRDEVSLCPGGTHEECPPKNRCNTTNLVCEEDLGCTVDADCGVDEVCNTGSHACVPRCTAETESTVCSAGEKCDGAKCVQCLGDQDCSPGLTCDAAGACSSAGRCYQDRDCKVPLICYEPTGACVSKPPPCISDENCTEEERCDVAAGTCVPRDCQADRFEPNDDQTKAFALSRESQQELIQLTLCPGDVDWYSIPLLRGDELGVNVEADPFAEFTFNTLIRDGSGRVLASGRQLVSYVASADQTYYLTVSTTDLMQPYDLTMLISRGIPCDDDGFEPNDAPASATALNASTTLDGAICPQDADHVSFVVPAGKGATVSLTEYDSSKGLLRLCLFDNGTQLGCSEESAPSVSADAAAVGGKTLIARVSGVSERAANSYTFQVVYP